MPISAGTAYVDVLPNMSKFAPAVQAQTAAAGSGLAKFGKVGALAVGAVGIASVGLAADFEKAMRNVNSIAQLPEPAFDRLNEKVLELAGPTAQAPRTLAEGLYDLVSSGFDANESLEILEASAFAATAGLTSTEVSTKGVAAVLNAYRLPAEKARLVSDQLFKTVDQGVITFDELAGGIGDTLPFAAALGVGLDEVGAATATMTKQGLSGAETFTRIRNLLQTIIKPGEELSAAIKDLGFESGEALIQEKGLQGALEALVGTTDGSKDAVAKLFPNIRALGGALALTGDNARAAREDLEGMKDAGGATQAAFEEQSKSLAVQFDRLKATLSVLAIEIGNALLPPLTEITKFINTNLLPAFRAIKSVVGPVMDFIGDKISVVGRFLLVAFGPVTAFIIANFSKIKAAAIATFDAIKSAGSALLGALRSAWNGIRSAATAAWNAIRSVATAAFGVIRSVATAAFNVIRAATAPMRATATAAFNAIRSVATVVFRTIISVGGTVFGALGKIIGVVGSVGTAVFGAIGDAVGVVIGIVGAAIDVVVALANALSSAIGAVGDLASSISSLPGKAIGLLPGLAEGGPLAAGQPAIVGEKGPELFVPRSSGRIIPNNRLRPAMAGGEAAHGREYAIVDLEAGKVFIRDLAASEIALYRRHDRQKGRMG